MRNDSRMDAFPSFHYYYFFFALFLLIYALLCSDGNQAKCPWSFRELSIDSMRIFYLNCRTNIYSYVYCLYCLLHVAPASAFSNYITIWKSRSCGNLNLEHKYGKKNGTFVFHLTHLVRIHQFIALLFVFMGYVCTWS